MRRLRYIILMLPFLVTVGCSGDGEPEPSKGTDQEPLPDDVELTVDGILGYLEKKETIVMVETKGILGEGLDGAFFLTVERSYGDVELVMEWECNEYRYTLKERDMEITGKKLVLDKGDTYFSYDSSNGAIDFLMKGDGWYREVTSRGMSLDIYDYRPTMEEFKAFEGEWLGYNISGTLSSYRSLNIQYYDGKIIEEGELVGMRREGIIMLSCSEDLLYSLPYSCGIYDYYCDLRKEDGILISNSSRMYTDIDTLFYTTRYYLDSISFTNYNTYNNKANVSWNIRKK